MTRDMMDRSRIGGGTVASQVRIEHTLFGYTLFPVCIAVLQWGGLHLRDGRRRALIPLRSNP